MYLSPDYQLKIDTLINKAYDPAKYGSYAYSDLNFYYLQKIVEHATSTPLDDYVAEIYKRMNLNDIGYLPKLWADIKNVAPTEFDALFRRDTVRGDVHDEFAAVSGGVGGHAGLFATAEALSGICQMFINYGIAANGEMIVDSSTIERFSQPKRYASGSIRALGFDKLDPNKSAYSYESYGHTGFTGTYFWIEPVKGYYVIFLTNRVHPTRANKKLGKNYREELWNQVKNIF